MTAGDACSGVATAARDPDEILADAGQVAKPPVLEHVAERRD
jgi:hypothetical protein